MTRPVGGPADPAAPPRAPGTEVIELRGGDPRDVPRRLAEVHRTRAPGDEVTVRWPRWSAARRDLVVAGAGFASSRAAAPPAGTERLTRLRTLPDWVGPDLRLLVVGLNPSLYAADAGVGFARPGNRFWPAASAAGVVTVDRDPRLALERDGVGMTDLVKRATARADELTRDEYRAGLDRLDALCRWLVPRVVCMVGLAGWRAAVDPRARPGRQESRLGGRPVYLMPSTSGLNASSSVADLTAHLAEASRLDAG